MTEFATGFLIGAFVGSGTVIALATVAVILDARKNGDTK